MNIDATHYRYGRIVSVSTEYRLIDSAIHLPIIENFLLASASDENAMSDVI